MKQITTRLAVPAALLLSACSGAAQPLTDYGTEVTYATKQAGADACAVKHSAWRCDLGDGVTLRISQGTPSSTGIPYISASLGFDLTDGTSPKAQMKKPGMKAGLKAMQRYGVKRDWVFKCLSKVSTALREKAGRRQGCTNSAIGTDRMINITIAQDRD